MMFVTQVPGQSAEHRDWGVRHTGCRLVHQVKRVFETTTNNKINQIIRELGYILLSKALCEKVKAMVFAAG